MKALPPELHAREARERGTRRERAHRLFEVGGRVCVFGVVESKQTTSIGLWRRLRLDTTGCEGSPMRGLVVPVDYYREEKE